MTPDVGYEGVVTVTLVENVVTDAGGNSNKETRISQNIKP
jgi:hypothetical protein